MNKIKLIETGTLNCFPIDNEFDPLYNILTNIKEINDIYKKYTNKSKQIFFFHRKKIENIFYDNEIIFRFEMIDFQKDYNLSELFYFNLLITNSPEIINYEYEEKYIFELNNIFFKKGKKNSCYYILISKMIIEIINNYKNSENFEYNISLDELLKEKKELIETELTKNEIFIELKYNYNDIIEKPIDEIYKDIIIYFIENNKILENNPIELLKELDMENIYITKNMFKGIAQCFNKLKNEYLDKYKIDDETNITEETIYFYNVLIRYIFKNPTYLYNIPFLKKNYEELIKNIYQNQKDNKNNKINFYLESEQSIYLFQSIYGKNIHNKSTLNSTKKKESQGDLNINLEKTIGKDNEDNNNNNEEEEIIEPKVAESVLENSKITLYNDTNDITTNSTNNNENNINYVIKSIIIGKDKDKKSLKLSLFKKFDQDLNNIENKKIMDNFGKLIDFLNKVKYYISQNELNYKPEIELELTKESEDYDNTNKGFYHITCISSFLNKEKEKYSFKDFNVLVNGIDEQPYGFLYLINELCNDDYKED